MRIKRVLGYDADDVLQLIGLVRRRRFVEAMIPAIGFVALGAAIGAGVGLMLAPSSGRRLRQDVSDRLDQIRERIAREAQKQGVEVANAPH